MVLLHQNSLRYTSKIVHASESGRPIPLRYCSLRIVGILTILSTIAYKHDGYPCWDRAALESSCSRAVNVWQVEDELVHSSRVESICVDWGLYRACAGAPGCSEIEF